MKTGKKLIIVFITILGIDTSFMHAIKNAPSRNYHQAFGDIVKRLSCISREVAQRLVLLHGGISSIDGNVHANCQEAIYQTAAY